MKCPECKSEAIPFLKWIQKHHAFNTECINCGIQLNANIVVYIGVITTTLVTLAIIPYLDDLFFLLEIDPQYKKFKIFVLLPVILLGITITWFTGSYKTRKNISHT